LAGEMTKTLKKANSVFAFFNTERKRGKGLRKIHTADHLAKAAIDIGDFTRDA